MKNWEIQSDKWKKFHESEIQYWKKINKIKNKAKNKIEKNNETVIYFNNFNKNLSAKTLNASSKISNI